MADATDRAPRRRRPAPKAGKATETPPKPTEKETPPAPARAPGKGSTVLQNKLERMIVSMGLPFAAAGDTHCALIFAQRGPIVAEAWANLAAESPAVKQVLESMLKGGAWTGAIGATVGLLLPVAVHHGAPVPDPLSMVMGLTGKQHQEEQYEEQSPVDATQNGHHEPSTVPGPAAFSAPAAPGDGPDPRDPSNYPGP